MEHQLKVGQLIKCALFKDAAYQARPTRNAKPVLDKMRLSMNGVTHVCGGWREQLEDRVHSYSLNTTTDGRFEDLPFKVIAISLIGPVRHETRRAVNAFCSSKGSTFQTASLRDR